MNRKTVLIVDDEVGFTRLVQLNLNCTGRYVVHALNDASVALRTARDLHPDLILLDVMMPGLDGGDVADQLQRGKATKDIPIVFLTAAVTKREVASSQGKIGGLSYIAKPVEFSDLLRCLDRLLSPDIPARTREKPRGAGSWLRHDAPFPPQP